MKSYIQADPWKIIEPSFDADLHPNTESVMSLGNGRMGQRANFAETYTGESLQGNYIAGIYYPDKTRVGWWKNGYPEYFAKVLNAVNWIKLIVHIDGEEIDLHKAQIEAYTRQLDMQHGVLSRDVTISTKNGARVQIISERFISISDQEMAYMKYEIQSLNQEIEVFVQSCLDFNVRNQDSNYDEDFWEERHQGTEDAMDFVLATTKKTGFVVGAACHTQVVSGDQQLTGVASRESGSTTRTFKATVSKSSSFSLIKKVSIASSFYHDENIQEVCMRNAQGAPDYKTAIELHSGAWQKRWEQCDIRIDGDTKAQQGIRFNIYQLYQTYSGEDPRLNIGPKGFTGEKYGGSTYWDTEAYCLPFYLSTASQKVARNLLVYRYNHLEKAIENATKLGFKKGAALYPMVTINGEECHNEWEITFEEIHRNGAIAYAIHNYTRYTGDTAYIKSHGIYVLIAIARFWSQRVHKSPKSGHFVLLGVTGPNEYENNVDNNWYTNYIAKWCLRYTLEQLAQIKSSDAETWRSIQEKTSLKDEESMMWEEIIDNIYLPYDKEKNIIVQHDGYLHNENLTVADLKSEDRPLNQKWSWDRILRSPFIKQADVLQGLYFFEDHFSKEEIERNFNFYEPRTVHESSLSPCVHSILASAIGHHEKAYEMYLRTARLDLDDYNNDTEDGCHITSMAGTWMSIIQGFAGMRVSDDVLWFSPHIPEQWDRYSFKVNFRKSLLEIVIDRNHFIIHNHSDDKISIGLKNEIFEVPATSEIKKKRNLTEGKP